MDSHKSSLSLFRTTFRSALKGNFIFPLLNMVALIILIPISCLTNVDISVRYITDDYSGITKLFNGFKYIIFNPNNANEINDYLHLSIIVFSVLLAISLFRFMINKQKINIFFSLGITRKNLFASKYLAGLLLLFISILLPFIVCFLLNVSVFGFSHELLFTIVYFIFGFFTLAAVCFSVAIAVFCCVGNIIEAIAFSGIVLAGPTSFCFCFELLMGKLTLGSPYGSNLLRFSSMNFDFNLIKILSIYNPILFIFNSSSNFGWLNNSSIDEKFIWPRPNFECILIWILICVLIFILGMFLFQRRKVEICGLTSINKWLNFITTFLVCFLPFSLAVSYISPLYLSLIIGIASIILIYIILDFMLNLNIKKWIKGLFKLPIHISIALLIMLICAAGLLGFSSKIPKIDDIQSADISPVAYTGIIHQFNLNFYGRLDDPVFSVGIDEPITGFKSKNDLEIITSIHRLIVKTGKIESNVNDYANPERITVNTSIKIIYHLKNGREINRYYSLATSEILNAMLSIDTTDRYKELISQNLNSPGAYKDPSYGIFAISNKLNSKTELVLSSSERLQLFEVLTKDLTAQTVNERFYPKEPAIGAIILSFYSGYIVTDSDSWIDLSMDGCPCIVITNDMVNTIEFLKSKGYIKYFYNSTKFIAAQIIDTSTTIIDQASLYSDSVTNHFMGGWNKTFYKFGYFENSYKVTDIALVNEIAENAHISYFNSASGYYVKFELANNGGYTTMYVPASKMPQSVIEGVANLGAIKTKS